MLFRWIGILIWGVIIIAIYKTSYFPYNFLLTCGLIIALNGAVLNMIVITSNGNRMPVKGMTKYFQTDTHFGYIDNSKVKLWWLSDIYTKGAKIFSIGDVLLYFGIVIHFLLWIIAIVLYIRRLT